MLVAYHDMNDCNRLHSLKTNLQGTVFHVRLSYVIPVARSSLVTQKSHWQLSSFTIACKNNFQKILKHTSKSYKILCIVHDKL